MPQSSSKRDLGRLAALLLLPAMLAMLLATGPPRASAADAPKKFAANLYSLRQHQVPDWFHDAKLGIFVHWGLYSVPGWAPPTGELGKVDPRLWFVENPYAEWYQNTMKLKESPTWKRHVEVYGEDFGYEDFIPLFREQSRKWDPREWARLFKEAGGRYVVLTSKHADGYPLWPTAVKHPYLPVDHLAAERDYVGELTRAVRNEGLKMGLYYCGGMDWSFVKQPVATFQDVFLTIPQSAEYVKLADAHWRELIDRYQPSILWNDIAYPRQGDFVGIVADYYNRFPEGVINNRFAQRPENADFLTPEYTQFEIINKKKWETCRGLGFSFGYNQAEGPEHVLSPDALVDLLVDITSKNGNLLLNVGPRADGGIPELQIERLRKLGKWLERNGEAIYGTRYWVTAEGRAGSDVRVRFTQKGDSVYAILLDEPKRPDTTLQDLWVEPGTTMEMLGAAGNLEWRQNGSNVAIQLPDPLPGAYAYAIKITPKPWKLMRE